MKTKTRPNRKTAAEYREAIENHYRLKYFNLFMNSYEWEGLTREEREFTMRQLWRRGVICAFRLSDDLLAFAPYAAQNFNMYGSPTEVNIINLRGVRYFPTKSLKTGTMRINEARMVEEPEVVLGWALSSYTPLKDVIEPLIQEIVDLEMCKRTNRFAQKLPILYGITPENRNKMDQLLEDVFNDELKLGVEITEVENIKGLQENPPFLIDKFNLAIESVEAKILTILGIDNGGRGKAERELVDEVNSNNELINDFQETVLGNLEEWVEMVNEAFGKNISVKPKFAAVDSFHEEVNGGIMEQEGAGKGETDEDIRP